jgi:hypothetical protein
MENEILNKKNWMKNSIQNAINEKLDRKYY